MAFWLTSPSDQLKSEDEKVASMLEHFQACGMYFHMGLDIDEYYCEKFIFFQINGLKITHLIGH